MVLNNARWTLALVLVTMASWLVIVVDVQRIQEDPGRLFLQARPPTIDRSRTGHRGQLNIPQSFAGLKVAPSIYRWMNGLYGGPAVTRIGITVAESPDPSLERRVPCCSGHLTATMDARNCTKMGGECCSREFTDYPGAGGMGLINPRKLKRSRQAYQGNCYQCYEFFTVCLVGN
ncbi:uncharacterized protein LOC116928032 [Daphnia magna]|uniref:uncharacterized protein LOC116928032 n=1 Tax=Daphnia magna TaxID=35525 RepID=UPI001E1BD7CA|nr:uncharacterized protein LOC116928032 [Daphnia magna]